MEPKRSNRLRCSLGGTDQSHPGFLRPFTSFLVPKLCLGTHSAKLCFACVRARETEFRQAGSQTEFGNQVREVALFAEQSVRSLPQPVILVLCCPFAPSAPPESPESLYLV